MLSITWQELLDNLTSDSKNISILTRISNNRCQENIINTCLSQNFYRDKLMDWMSHIRTGVKWEKLASRASAFRLQGNTKYQQKNDGGSLALYTQSIIHAPKNSEELSLALANRSAVLYRMKLYQDCLRDIALALQHGYPSFLKYKLILRRGQCLENLGQHKEAMEILQQAMTDVSLDKNSMLKKDLEAALAAVSANLKSGSRQNLLPESPIVEIPTPTYGENKNLAYASAVLELKYNADKGRHIITNRDIKMGDILFVEKPYAFVVLPDQYKSHCHHCCSSYLAPIPCLECIMALYCSDDCRRESWEQYHRWECGGGLEIMHSIGIAHLGLRVVLKAGPLCKLKARYTDLKGKSALGIDGKYGNKTDNYDAVYHLMPHLEKMQTEDLFQYATTATMLTLYLRHCTDYFGTDPDQSTLCLVGGLILRHIAQLVCNAHAITKLQTLPPEHENQQVVTETQVRVATAIYPTASMMNHSCDPSIINSFHNEVLIVRACKDIPNGGEVFNCYGPHFRHMKRKDRQEVLQSQYFFKCVCEPCSLPLQQDFQERFCALLCSECTGPLIRNDNSAHDMTCSDCGHSQDYSSHVEATFRAHALYNEGCTTLELGNMKEAVDKFESCLALRKKCLYRSHRELTTCADQIAKCYAMLGEYNKSIQFLLDCLPAIEEQFGSCSIEVANELQKLSDVMICDLETCSPGSNIFFEKHKKATEYVQRARQILELHYGKWNSALRDILAKEHQLLQLHTK